ncbi:MAG: FIST N-terminal domain-containing protein [Polyangiales bacterium]
MELWSAALGTPLARDVRWALVHSTVDADHGALRRELAASGAVVFGATSFRGVFVPDGFERGAFALLGRAGDPTAVSVSRRTDGRTARSAAVSAAHELRRTMDRPDVLLLYATPGFEERVLEGIDEAFGGSPPPLYGGSAADDDLSGQWRVFAGSEALESGFVLVGFTSKAPVHGSFVAGYNPGSRRGKVTSASGRVLRKIDGRPAAEVYDEWLGGALSAFRREGGVVLGETTMHPLGRVVDKVGAIKRYVLTHPHRVERDGSLALFADVAEGDELVLMVGSREALFDRTDQVAARAGRSADRVSGAILVYCGGCVGVTGDATGEVSKRFGARIDGAPFLGAATFGEQGCFTGPTPTNRHGNLMADAILFE